MRPRSRVPLRPGIGPLRLALLILVAGAAVTPGFVTGNAGLVGAHGGSPLVPFTSALQAGPITPADPGVDNGQSVALTANPSGGSGNYTIQWYNGTGSGGCSSGSKVGTNSTSFTTPALTQSGSPYHYCYNVTDTASATANSVWDAVTVDPPLTAPAEPTVSATVIDADQALTVTATLPSSGTPPYSWTWLLASNAPPFAGATICATNSGAQGSPGAVETCQVAANRLTAGHTYAFELRVTDNATSVESATSTNSSWVSVNAALSAGDVTPTSPAIDAGQNVSLTASPSGGTPPYGYQWYSSSTGSGACSSGTALGKSSSEIAAPTSATYYCYVVTDAAPTPATKSSVWDEVTVNPELSASPPTPKSPTIDFGQSIVLTAQPSGGTSPYTYRWHWSASSTGACGSGALLGTSSTQATGSEVTGPGTYYYCYVVSDNSGANGGPLSTSSAWNPVTVNSALTGPNAPAVSATKLDVDEAFTVTGVIPSTGTPTYSWEWLVATNGGAFGKATECAVPTGSGTSAGATETCSVAPKALIAGDTYDFELQVTDGAASPETMVSAASPALTVSSALTAPAAPTPSTTSLDPNQPLTVTGTIPSTGTPTYSWQWRISVGGKAYGNAIECGASASGSGGSGGAQETCTIPGSTLAANTSYAFELRVTDNASAPDSRTSAASATVRTSSVLSAGTPSPGTVTLDSGQAVTLTAKPSGGTSPYHYQWYSGATAAGCTGLGSPIFGATSSTYSAAPTTTTYFCYVVTDAHTSTSVSVAGLLTVNPALSSPATPTPNATGLDADQPLSVMGTIPSTGTPAYSWQWLLSRNGSGFVAATVCATNNGSGALPGASEACDLLPLTLPANATYAFELEVTDNATAPVSATSAASAAVNVGAPLAPPNAPTPSTTALSVNDPLTVSGMIPSTGTAPYSWQWWVSADGSPYANASLCAVGNGSGASAGAPVLCAMAADSLPGGHRYAFELRVTDSATVAESATSPPSAVVATSSVLVAGSPGPKSPRIDLGQSVMLTANASGGSGSYSYQWYSGTSAAGCASLGSPIAGATSANYTSSPRFTTYFCYVVSDPPPAVGGAGSIVSASVLVTVYPALTAPPAPASSTTAPSVDQPLTVSATIPATGTAPYSWQWLVSINGGAFVSATACGASSRGEGASAGAQETCTIPPDTLAVGTTYVFKLEVRDSATLPTSVTSTNTSAITVRAATTGTSPSSSLSIWPYVGVVLFLVGVVALAAFSLRRRRRGRAAAHLPVQPWTPGPTPPSGPAGGEPGLSDSLGPIELASSAAARPVVTVAPSAAPPAPVPGESEPAPEGPIDIGSVLEEIDRISADLVRRAPGKEKDQPPEQKTTDAPNS